MVISAGKTPSNLGLAHLINKYFSMTRERNAASEKDEKSLAEYSKIK